MIGFMDYTRWIAIGLALAVFIVSRTAIPNDIAKAAFVDQPSQAYAGMQADQALKVTEVSGFAPRVAIEDSSIGVGETVGVPITLSSAPEGLAGYHLLLDLGDARTARIVSVEFPQFGMVGA